MTVKPSLLITLIFCLLSCQKEIAQPQDTFWQTADPQSHNFDLDALTTAIQAADDLSNFYALLVIRDQKLVVEKYFEGRDQNDLFHLRSITKNITSALTGIAINNGLLEGLEEPIKAYFPEYIEGEKESITIGHLLNMTSGLEWNEDREVLDAIEHRIQDPVKSVLSRSLMHTPATQFNYNSLSSHVVADILRQKNNQDLSQYAEKKLFELLGIKQFGWDRDPQGKAWGGFGLQLTARDLAKFGQLYLNQGRWENRQVVPQEWVLQSAVSQVADTGTSAGYSLQWWTSNNLDTPIYFGLGYGGQALMLVPQKKMIVVALQNHLVSSEKNVEQWNNFVAQVFVPINHAAGL